MSNQIDKIKTEIYEQADVELEKIKSETNEKIKIIQEATDKEINKIKQTIEEASKSNIENQSKRDLGQARLQAKMSYLSEKESGISTVFEEGKKKIATLLQTSDYGSILSDIIVSAGVSLGGGNLMVSLSKADQSKINLGDIAQKISAKSGVNSSVTFDGSELKTKLGGAIIKKDDLWVDNTFDAIIERRNEVLRAEISKILFV